MAATELITSESIPKLLKDKALTASRASLLLALYPAQFFAPELLTALQEGVAQELARFSTGPAGAIKPAIPRRDTRLALPIPGCCYVCVCKIW